MDSGSGSGSGRMQEVPPLRQFMVAVESVDEKGVAGHTPVIIEAHEPQVHVSAAGNVLTFIEYYLCPVEGPTRRVKTCLNGGWGAFKDVTPPREAPAEDESRIIIPDGGSIH